MSDLVSAGSVVLAITAAIYLAPVLHRAGTRWSWEWRRRTGRAWVLDPQYPSSVAHRGGVPWAHAPLPKLRHRCRAQTRSTYLEHCACGGRRDNCGGVWQERNIRRSPPPA